MTDTQFPKWSIRLDAFRSADSPGFGDLLPVVSAHLRLHASAEQFLGPYNARQRSSTFPYQAPSRETLKQVIKQGGVNEFSYNAFIAALIRFCESTKGLRALPTPHPSTIHSIQLPLPAFELKNLPGGDTMVSIAGVETPLLVKGLRHPDEIKFIIVRPKLSKLGTASASRWEILFFRTSPGYIADWADTQINTRYVGLQ